MFAAFMFRLDESEIFISCLHCVEIPPYAIAMWMDRKLTHCLSVILTQTCSNTFGVFSSLPDSIYDYDFAGM